MIHLCNNFVASAVHSRLIIALRDLVSQQTVIVPVRKKRDIGRHRIDCDGVTVSYIRYVNSAIRYFPLLKTLCIFLLIFKQLNRAYMASRGSCVHVPAIAHNFWSDGVPLFIYSFFRPINYVLVIRNTDINIFIPRLPHYHFLMRQMIKRASAVVFVSPAHHKRFLAKFSTLRSPTTPMFVIPNALDNFWHENISFTSEWRAPQACFVGKFDRNKNLPQIFEAAERVAGQILNFRLKLIGGSSTELRDLLKIDDMPAWVDVLGRIENREALKNIYRSCRVFVMPSRTETFGLVYLEALSQGCSVICSKNEGIDGCFDASSVIAVSPSDLGDIERALLSLLERFPRGTDPDWAAEALERYRWSYVARRYIDALRIGRDRNLRSSVST